jgi:hypothetical protein
MLSRCGLVGFLQNERTRRPTSCARYLHPSRRAHPSAPRRVRPKPPQRLDSALPDPAAVAPPTSAPPPTPLATQLHPTATACAASDAEPALSDAEQLRPCLPPSFLPTTSLLRPCPRTSTTWSSLSFSRPSRPLQQRSRSETLACELISVFLGRKISVWFRHFYRTNVVAAILV